MTPGMFIPLPGCAKFRYFLQWNFAVVGTPKLQDVSGFRTQSLIGALLGGSHEQTGKLGTKNVRSTQDWDHKRKTGIKHGEIQPAQDSHQQNWKDMVAESCVSTQCTIDWLVVWNMNFIFPYIGKNHPNWLIFFRGVETTNQFKKPSLGN